MILNLVYQVPTGYNTEFAEVLRFIANFKPQTLTNYSDLLMLRLHLDSRLSTIVALFNSKELPQIPHTTLREFLLP